MYFVIFLFPSGSQLFPIRINCYHTTPFDQTSDFSDHGRSGVLRLEAYPTMVFDIIDSGIGIEPEDQEELFEPFIQADNTSTRSFGGTGLSLTICRWLARGRGGDVSVRSEPGKGSTFTLTIHAPATGPLIKPDLNLSKVAEASTELISSPIPTRLASM